MRGIASIKKEFFRDAITDLSNAIVRNPVNYEAYHYRGLAFFIIGENEKALQDMKQSINIYPFDDFALYVLELINKRQASK